MDDDKLGEVAMAIAEKVQSFVADNHDFLLCVYPKQRCSPSVRKGAFGGCDACLANYILSTLREKLGGVTVQPADPPMPCLACGEYKDPCDPSSSADCPLLDAWLEKQVLVAP